MSTSELTKNAEILPSTSDISATGADEVQSVALHRRNGETESHGDGVAAADSESAAETIAFTGTPEVMTVDEVAEFTRLDRNTVYGCIRRGELAVCRCGRIIRVHREAVLDWLRGNTRVTRSSRRRSS
jgi:excisionase family DNA binding protein